MKILIIWLPLFVFVSGCAEAADWPKEIKTKSGAQITVYQHNPK